MKKIITILLAVVIVAGSAVTTYSAVANNQEPVVANNQEEEKTVFDSISGIVKEVNESGTGQEKVTNVTIEESNGNPANIIIRASAFNILGNATSDIKKNDKIVGYYDTTQPMIMIYPPQYNVAAYAVNLPDSHTIKVDLFNDELVSSDNMLKLNMDDKVKIYAQDGSVYKDSIEGKELVVLYTVSTRSIPAQTTPEKIIVLDDNSVQNRVKEFDAITGTITKIQKVNDKNKKAIKGQRLVTIKTKEGTTNKFLINKNTYFASGKLSTLKVKQEFTGYYDISKVKSTQLTAVAVATNLKNNMVTVDRFDKNLVSSNGSLVLTPSKQTKIVTQAGKSYKGSLKNKVLVVVYDKVTRSYPGQTTPKKIIVLNVK